MAAHKVTCRLCGKQFDINSIQGVKIGNLRYAHKTCADEANVQYELVPIPEPVKNKRTKEKEDREKLIEYAKEHLGDAYVRTKVEKQIREFHNTDSYTYSGMLKTLIWFYEIQGNSWDKAQGGIGIIPYVYKDAMNYYYAIYLAQLAGQSIVKEDLQVKVREVVIDPPVKYIQPPKLFNLD